MTHAHQPRVLQVSAQQHGHEGNRHLLPGRSLCVALILSSAMAALPGYAAKPISDIPRVIQESESFEGTWTWNGKEYVARWTNGAVATMRVVKGEFKAGSRITIERTDTPESSTPGLTAVYHGVVSPQGNSMSGMAIWVWRGFRTRTKPGGKTHPGAWHASWSMACGAQSLLPVQPGAVHLCGDSGLPFNYARNNNFHHYEDISTVCQRSQSAACTAENVFTIMLRTPEAIAPVDSTVTSAQIAQCAILQLISCPGANNQIRIFINNGQHSVTNYTLPGHLFYPGQVLRQVVARGDTVAIKTVGEGVGCNLSENLFGAYCKIWPDADQALRTAVWLQLGLGQAPPLPNGLSVCRFGLGLTMWACGNF